MRPCRPRYRRVGLERNVRVRPCGLATLGLDRHVPRRRDVGEQRVRHDPVAVRGRVEPVVAEHAGVGAEDRADLGRQIDDGGTGGAGRAGLGARDPASVPPDNLAQRGSEGARTAPRSGQVPTTTAVPASRRRRTAVARAVADSPGRTRWVASFVPTRITAMLARGPSWARATCVARSAHRAPETATHDTATRAPASASRWASWPPTVSSTDSTPTPRAVASPSRTIRSGWRVGGPDRGAYGEAEVGSRVPPRARGERLRGEDRRATDRAGDHRDRGRLGGPLDDAAGVHVDSAVAWRAAQDAVCPVGPAVHGGSAPSWTDP